MRLEVQKSYLISCDLRFKIIFYIYKCFFCTGSCFCHTWWH